MKVSMNFLCLIALLTSLHAFGAASDSSLEGSRLRSACQGDMDLKHVLDAARSGNTQLLGDYKARGFDFNQSDHNGFTVAHYAAIGGSIRSLRWIQRNKITLDQQNEKRNIFTKQATPYALIIRALNRYDGKDVGFRCGVDKLVHDTLEMHAGHDKEYIKSLKRCLGLLKSFNAHLASVRVVDGVSQLHKAAMYGKLTQMKRCLDSGVLVDTTDSNERTPLHNAAMRGNAQAIKLLVDRGANVHAFDNKYRTPAHWIVFKAHDNDYNKTPISQEKAIECLKILIENGGYNIHCQDGGDVWYRTVGKGKSSGRGWPTSILGWAYKNDLDDIAYFLQTYKSEIQNNRPVTVL